MIGFLIDALAVTVEALIVVEEFDSTAIGISINMIEIKIPTIRLG